MLWTDLIGRIRMNRKGVYANGILVVCVIAFGTTFVGCGAIGTDCPDEVAPSIVVDLADDDGNRIGETGFVFEYRKGPNGAWQGCRYGGGEPSDQCGNEEAGTFSVRAYDDTRFGMSSGIRVTKGRCNVRTRNVTLTVSEGGVPE